MDGRQIDLIEMIEDVQKEQANKEVDGASQAEEEAKKNFS